MDETTTFTIELAKLLPVIIGALLAAVSGLITQAVIHLLSVKKEKRKNLIDKGEKLVELLYSQQNWLLERFQVLLIENQTHSKPAPLNLALVIQGIYFRELSDEFSTILNRAGELNSWLFNQKIARLENEKEWLANLNNEKAKFLEDFDSLSKALNTTVKKINDKLQPIISD